MKKLLVTGLVGGLATVGVFLLPAHANDCPGEDLDPSDQTVSVQSEVGGVCAAGDPATQTGSVWADGEDGNPDPAGGYASLDSDKGLCADDNGGPAEGGDSPTCLDPDDPQPPTLP